MDQILVITDDLNDTVLVNFAYKYASQNNKEVILASKQHLQPRLAKRELALTGGGRNLPGQSVSTFYDNVEDADMLPPGLSAINTSGLSNQAFSSLVNNRGFSLVIARINTSQFDLQLVLNNINCPLMVLPVNSALTAIKRITYLTDLRYCQQPILANLARYNSSGLLIAHICESGLPDLGNHYGNQLFADSLGRFCDCGNWFFSHIYEKDFKRIADTLVNTMRTDLMVCSNRKYHFNQLFVDGISKSLPGYLSVPIMIYPY